MLLCSAAALASLFDQMLLRPVVQRFDTSRALRALCSERTILLFVFSGALRLCPAAGVDVDRLQLTTVSLILFDDVRNG